MASDVFGNYAPGLKSLAPTSASTDGPVRRQHGAPDATTPLYPLIVIDEDTGNVYINVDGTTSGWTLFVGGGSGSGTVGSTAIVPTGVTVITGKGVLFGDLGSPVDGTTWIKTSSGSGSDWRQL